MCIRDSLTDGLDHLFDLWLPGGQVELAASCVDVRLHEPRDRCDVRVPRPPGLIAVTVHASVRHQLLCSCAVPGDPATAGRIRVVAAVRDELDRDHERDDAE